MVNNGFKIKTTMREFFKNNFLYTTGIESVSDDDSFMDKGIIDSTGILELIDFIEERYEISVENGDIVPENLDSFNSIERYILSKK